ncbi:regulator of cell morphogenesis and NO signaling [Catalinimonas alkaloidigena]|uniref:iron-sulfur cluster repair di-iron protein n=1 Tax=Catalinimonas alkaloidigena TaxID=1075417 RepID=UPI0024059E59|nr:iron-sulfur cluster repair di-iron protein [Catalinimonas alkaloidigena]MDF9801346.1 regulator of cell morphogenesis and NO signaling [Catalinimonas alkaloidigena]
MSTIDVREIAPKDKHQFIFESFDKLPEGESLMLINDHDPKPLFYQFQEERPGQLQWKVLQAGPEVWQVQIHKQPAKITVGEVVQQYPQAAAVFHKLKIDYCCGGKRSFEDACRKAGVDPEEVNQAIRQVQPEKQNLRVSHWPLSMLCDFIVNNHHEYIRNQGPQIHLLAEKVSKVHGKEHPELIDIYHDFIELHEELLQHLHKEEDKLFPLIKAWDQQPVSISEAEIAELLKELNEEHEGAGDEMKRIRNLTNDYTLPEDACQSYKMLYQELAEFEEDLYAHVHLENNILFPKFIKQLQMSKPDTTSLH